MVVPPVAAGRGRKAPFCNNWLIYKDDSIFYQNVKLLRAPLPIDAFRSRYITSRCSEGPGISSFIEEGTDVQLETT